MWWITPSHQGPVLFLKRGREEGGLGLVSAGHHGAPFVHQHGRIPGCDVHPTCVGRKPSGSTS